MSDFMSQNVDAGEPGAGVRLSKDIGRTKLRNNARVFVQTNSSNGSKAHGNAALFPVFVREKVQPEFESEALGTINQRSTVLTRKHTTPCPSAQDSGRLLGSHPLGTGRNCPAIAIFRH